MPECERVALFLDGETFDRWQFEATARMVKNTDAEVSLLVINEDPHSKLSKPVSYYQRKISRHWPWIPIWMAQNFRNLLFGPPDHLDPVAVDEVDFLSGVRRLYVEPIEVNNYTVRFPDEAVSIIGSSADLSVLFGFGIIQGDILKATEYGVLGFHHGDMSKYRGRPAGFWELLNEEDRVGVTLQRLSEELDQGEVIVYNDVKINNNDTWQDVTSKLYGKKSKNMLEKAIIKLNKEGFTPNSIDPGNLYTLPQRLSTVVRYAWKNTRRRLR